MERHVVVIIEDEEDSRESLRELLEVHGFAVVTAANGRAGLDLLERIEKPCLILVDLIMPVMDGWEFLGHVARSARLVDIPVMIATSAPDKAPAGFAVLPKPVDSSALIESVRRHC